jgi:hypothetical protein
MAFRDDQMKQTMIQSNTKAKKEMGDGGTAIIDGRGSGVASWALVRLAALVDF